jgi:hypothetical protein
MRVRHFIFILSVSTVISLAAYGVWLITSSRGATAAHANLATRNTSKAEEKLLRAAQTEQRHCPKSDGTKLTESPETHHHKVILTWNASANDPRHEVVGYCLYRIASKDQPHWAEKCKNCEQVNQKSIDGTACVDDVVQDGAKYYYVAMAINRYGQTSSLSNDTLAEIPPTAEINGPVNTTSYPRCRKDNQPQ